MSTRQRVSHFMSPLALLPVNLEWFHCLVRYKESATSSLLIKRALKAGMDLGSVDWRVSLPALTRECIERLEAFTPLR